MKFTQVYTPTSTEGYRHWLRLLTLALLLTLGWGESLYAQFTQPDTPYSLGEAASRQLRSATRRDTLQLPQPSSEAWRSLSKQAGQEDFRSLRFALPLAVDISPSSQGEWQTLAGGKRLWRLSLKAGGAQSLGLRFDRYRLPRGAKLYIHGKGGVVRGAYTEENNNPHNELNIAHMRGETLTLELNLPEGIAPSEVQLHLSQVQYGALDPYQTGESLRASSAFNIAGEPFYNLRGTGLSRLSCAPNVVSYPEYRNQSRSVLLLVMEGNTMGTGTLINNSSGDGTAYVLTAAHNLNRVYNGEVNTWAEVEAVCRTIVFFFGFESPSKDQDMRGTEELTLSGAELIAYNTEADMALLKISGLPTDALTGERRIPEHYQPYFSGWSISPQPQGQFFGIHHALASTKRISVSKDTQLQLKDYSVAGQDWVQKHYSIVEWSVGTTEAGASGSALFDKDGRIVGALSGGRSTCNSPYSDTYYAIAQTWDNGNPRSSLKPWLDPLGTHTALEGYDPMALSSAQISRVSEYYAGSTSPLVWQSYKPIDGVSGIGRIVRLSGTAEPLGVYLQLGASENALGSSPSYTIELHSISGGEVSSSPVWSTQLSNYNYTSYSEDRVRHEPAIRTVGQDEIELFVPSQTQRQLTAGDYLLSIRSTDNSKLDYPLLVERKRKTSAHYIHGVWQRHSQRGWTKATGEAQAVWLDLLVKGSPQREQLESEFDACDCAQTSYYHGGIIYTNTHGAKAELRVYSLDGTLWHKAELNEGENRTNISTLPEGYIYVVYIEGEKGSYSYKIAR